MPVYDKHRANPDYPAATFPRIAALAFQTIKTGNQNQEKFMSQESEKNIREQLVESGLWLESDPRDPSVNYDAARELNRRSEKRFGVELRRSFTGWSGADPIFFGRSANDQSVIELKGGDVLARSSNFPMTSCIAAIELHRRFKLEG